MPVDARVEEAFSILFKPGGAAPEAMKHARELLKDWLHDEELAEAADLPEEADPSTSWADGPPPELLNEKLRGLARRPGKPIRQERSRKPRR